MRTKRKELWCARDTIATLRDTVAIAQASPDDCLCITERRESEIPNPIVRNAVERHAYDLSLLVQNVQSSLESLACNALPASLDGKWRAWVLKGEKTFDATDHKAVEFACEQLKAIEETMATTERDDVSSSSDYSDSTVDTETSETVTM